MADFAWISRAFLIWSGSFFVAGGVCAAEPARDFLNGLRDRGYHDTALDYLDQMASSQLAPAEFQQTILYEKGVTLIQASRNQRDSAMREQQLNEAQEVLEQFVKKHKSHYLASSANNQVATLLVERARVLVDEANQSTTSGPEKRRLANQARKMFDEAHAVFTKSRDDLRKRLEEIPKYLNSRDPEQKKLIPVQNQYRADSLQAMLLIPRIEEEKAQTFAEGSQKRKELLLSAADQYGLVYDNYRTRIAGLYARMHQGRCYSKLKDYEEALSYFGELMDQPNQPDEFRELKKRTLILAVDCWFGPTDKKLYHDAILRIGQMVEILRPDEARDPEWLYLRLALAKAYQAYANDARNNREKGIALGNARNHANFVTRYDSRYRREAQEFLAALRGRTLAPEEQKEPTTFADARQAGKDALDEWQAAQLTVTTIEARLQQEKNPKQKDDLVKDLQEAKQRVEEGPAKSLNYFQLALSLSDSETPLDDVNVVRYFLAFWYHTLGDYYDAALIGEFVARRYPGTPGAPQCGQIALASYVKLFTENQSGDRTFEINRVVGISEYIIDTWPDQPETVIAADMLVKFMINDRQLDRAVHFLSYIPETSPLRATAELNTGQALWRTYSSRVNQLREEAADDPQTDQDQIDLTELEPMQKQAETILSAGIQRSATGTVDESLQRAALSLAQLHVESGESKAAIDLLEDEKIGPLKLVRDQDPLMQRSGLAVEALRTGLRAYIGSLKSGGDQQAAFKQSRELIDLLNAELGDTPSGRQSLVATYIKLATDIKQQLDATPPGQRDALANGFAAFLRQVRAGADDLSLHIWAATSFAKLGESSPQSPQFFTDAIIGFETILEKGSRQAGWLPDDDRMRVLMQLATTQQRTGQFEKALDSFEKILSERNSRLNVQVAAAETLQAWAEKQGDQKLYARAIAGDRKDQRKTVNGQANRGYRKNTIWGWGKISQSTAPHKEFRDVFHQARYHLAECRRAHALLDPSAKTKEKWLRAAKRDITYTKSLYPVMGGKKWWDKYDALLKDIQQDLGEARSGLGKPPRSTASNS